MPITLPIEQLKFKSQLGVGSIYIPNAGSVVLVPVIGQQAQWRSSSLTTAGEFSATFVLTNGEQLSLNGSFTKNTAGSGHGTYGPEGPNQTSITWTAEPMIQLPVRDVPFYVNDTEVGTIMIDTAMALWFTPTGPSQTAAKVGSLDGYLNLGSGELSTVPLSPALRIGSDNYTTIGGFFTDQNVAIGGLGPDNVSWYAQPEITLPTANMPFTVAGSNAGTIAIDADKNLLVDGASKVSVQHLLNLRSGRLSPTTINLVIGPHTYTTIHGHFNPHGGKGGIRPSKSRKREDDAWVATDSSVP